MHTKLEKKSEKRVFEGVNLSPIMVQEPKFGRMLDVAPILFVIVEIMEGTAAATDHLSAMIEDIAGYGGEFLESPEFTTHIYHMAMLRRAIAAMIIEE